MQYPAPANKMKAYHPYAYRSHERAYNPSVTAQGRDSSPYTGELKTGSTEEAYGEGAQGAKDGGLGPSYSLMTRLRPASSWAIYQRPSIWIRGMTPRKSSVPSLPVMVSLKDTTR